MYTKTLQARQSSVSGVSALIFVIETIFSAKIVSITKTVRERGRRHNRSYTISNNGFIIRLVERRWEGVAGRCTRAQIEAPDEGRAQRDGEPAYGAPLQQSDDFALSVSGQLYLTQPDGIWRVDGQGLLRRVAGQAEDDGTAQGLTAQRRATEQPVR